MRLHRAWNSPLQHMPQLPIAKGPIALLPLCKEQSAQKQRPRVTSPAICKPASAGLLLRGVETAESHVRSSLQRNATSTTMDQRPLRGGMKAVVTTVVALVFAVTTTSDGADGKPTRSMGVICSVDADGNPELQVHDAPSNVFTD